MKWPFIKFFTGDWKKDPALTRCSPATRGVWIDLLCDMHELDRSGELRGTHEQLARAARCTIVEIAHALTELQATEAADVTERNGVVTVRNRRMKRDANKRQQSAIRMMRMRRYGDVTGDVTPPLQSPLRVRSQKSEHKLKSDKGGEKVLAKLTGKQQQLADAFEQCLGKQWVNDAGKWVNRIKKDAHKCERVVAEIESAIKEQRVNTTPAQYAESIWKEFA